MVSHNLKFPEQKKLYFLQEGGSCPMQNLFPYQKNLGHQKKGKEGEEGWGVSKFERIFFLTVPLINSDRSSLHYDALLLFATAS